MTTWRCRHQVLDLGPRTLIMGVVNVTPDSFSDGGQFLAPKQALDQARAMIDAGVDILDIGGESSRPGAKPVSAEAETERVVPVIEAICRDHEVLVSVDTTKASVAEAALEAGAHIVNDISAGTMDDQLPSIVKKFGAGFVLMHMQGTPRSMQDAPHYDDVVADICGYLSARLDALEAAGIARECMAVDPGIGFGKTLPHNLQLLGQLSRFAELQRPLLVGLSRKRFIGELTGRDIGERLSGSLAGLSASVMQGAHIMRVHDVAESRDVVTILDALMEASA